MLDAILEFLPVFLLVFVRLATFFVTAPIFAMSNVPIPFKVGLAFFIAVLSFTAVPVGESIEVDAWYVLFILKEAMIGLALGFVTSLLMYVIQVAGSFIDFQMGFMIANLVDPQTGVQVPVMSNLKYMLAMMFFLAVDGHHMLLQGIMHSYSVVPVDQLGVAFGSESVAYFVLSIFTNMFLSAFQLALPIVGSLFLVDVALGILARTVPQVNVFVVGLPLKIFVGFVILWVTISIIFYLLNGVFREMLETMGQLLQLLGGS